MEQSSNKILVKRDGSTIEITLNRGAKMNALDGEMLDRLTGLFHELLAEVDVRVVLIRAEGRAFCAGADIGGYDDHTEASFLEYQRRFQRMTRAIEELPRPVVAAVHGYALGGGCILANACDLVIAADDAKFGLPEINIGMFGGGPRLASLLGKHQCMEIMMLGEPIAAPEARSLGLANRVVARADLDSEARVFADALSSRAPLALAAVKRFVQEADEASLSVRLNLERSMLGALFATEDAREGVTAFVEKRAPQFQGK